MNLFSSLVLLLFISAFLLAGSRRLGLPYPAFLCIAGVGVGLLPGAPDVVIEPHLALVLFIAPALLDAAYDTSPWELRRLWAPLLNLAVGAVLVTAAVVAAVAMHLVPDLPLYAALALGAAVAPPDAAAANAILSRVPLPRHSSLVLQGESLLNDASALLLFGAATSGIATGAASHSTFELAMATPGGIALGLAAGWLYPRLMPFVAGPLSGILVEFTATFGVWLIADALHFSPVLAVACFAMMLARMIPALQGARDRVQSYAVWAAAVFGLNVLAFLLMGLQARAIFSVLRVGELWPAVGFAICVFLAVVLTRIACVLSYRAIAGAIYSRFSPSWLVEPPSWRISLLVAWCGMRGLLTLATAFALPHDFPHRNLMVLAAFTVVLGTLAVQGGTLLPLMRLLGTENDDSLRGELADARRKILSVGLDAARRERAWVAAALARKLEAEKRIATHGDDPQGTTDFDNGLARVVEAQRAALHDLRDSGAIAEDVFHLLEHELDRTELSTVSPRDLESGEV